VGLAGCLIYVLARQWREGVNLKQPAMTAAIRPAQAVAASPPFVAQPAEPKPFRWNQLVSPNDYRVFVANLRATGCPEPTVEDIVRGDAERAFFAKRSELHLDGSGTGAWSAQAQVQMVASLLGEKFVSSGEEPAPAQSARSGHQPPEDGPVSMPLVLQNIDPAALGLNDEQMQVIANLRQNFLEQIGGTNQNPNDPAYLVRWQKAQPESDNMIKGLLGGTIFENYQLAAQGSSQGTTAVNP